MTSQPPPVPDDASEDAFGEPARTLSVPHPDWMPASASNLADASRGIEPGAAADGGALPAGRAESAPLGEWDRGTTLAGASPSARLERDDSAHTLGASFDAAGDAPLGAPFATPLEAPLEAQFSHLGLTAVDPWAPIPRWYEAIWPWGWSGVIEMLDVLVLALLMFMGVRFMAHNYIVDGASMSPTFEDSDFLVVNRMAYRSFDLSWIPGIEQDAWRPLGEPEPGDVVVFHFQPATSDRDFIKRVIAVPGQTVHVTGGSVYVDDVRLDEPYIAEPPNYEFPPTLVEPGMVFVLGDNRNNSYDSHAFGPIEQSTIVGRADFRYWPASRWGLVEHVIGGGQQLAGRALGGMAALWP